MIEVYRIYYSIYLFEFFIFFKIGVNIQKCHNPYLKIKGKKILKKLLYLVPKCNFYS